MTKSFAKKNNGENFASNSLGIIPGPHEPPGNINSYLEPLVDDLVDLWDGISIPGEQLPLRAAVLTATADMPALRKLTQFLGHKANLGCSRCKFVAEREPGTVGASGKMSYFTKSLVPDRRHNEVVQQGHQYNAAQTKKAAAQIAQKNGVRYSELMRLPYFDIVKMCATDPMHTILLGMVKKETELNLRLLGASQKKEFIRRVKSVRVPYDLGRLPNNIFDEGEEPNGITADQWKLYIITYARPCMYKLLPDSAYNCLVLLSEIVSIIVSPAFTHDDIDRLTVLLKKHHDLFAKVYGKWAVSVNYHMSLHLPDMILDLGPPHSFWCFAYERMNGFLAGTPNSNRNIESEVAKRFVEEMAFHGSDIPHVDMSTVPQNLREFISTGTEDAYQPSCPLTHLVMSVLEDFCEDKFQAQQKLERGDVQNWPIDFKNPCKKNVRLTPFYLGLLESFFEGIYEDGELEYVLPRIDMYGRCTVNGMNFSSDFNSSDRGNVVKAMFADTSNELTPYFGVVSFYFKATAMVLQEPKVHHLACVNWLKFRSYGQEKVTKLRGVNHKEFYQTDPMVSPRRFIRRCVLISPNPKVPLSLVSELSK